jgi:hypothetical protein
VAKEFCVSNSIFVIQPYWHVGTWVFDDGAVGLRQEPFVAGIPEMIDALLTRSGILIDEARKGFRLTFSAAPFPGASARFDRTRSEVGGTWYCTPKDDPQPGMEGWLCPALFKYFPEAPPSIYVKAERLSRR